MACKKNKIKYDHALYCKCVGFFQNENKEITTTTTSLKKIRPFVEKVITRAMKTKADLHSYRLLLSLFKNNEKIVNEVYNAAEKVKHKTNGGYTRFIKLGRRQGDSACISMLKLDDRLQKS